MESDGAARLRELEESLRDAEERATRATARARDADESYRKLQLELVRVKDEAQERIDALEKELAASRAAPPTVKSAPPPPSKPPTEPPAKDEPQLSERSVQAHVAKMLEKIAGLRDLLATASTELSELHADEVALAKRRSRVLTDACTLLARAVGESGEAPPPIPTSLPNASLEKKLSVLPSVDISEVAELIESLRAPRPPKVD